MIKKVKHNIRWKWADFKWSILVIAVFMTIFQLIMTSNKVNATSCPDLKVIFARGSGGERFNNGHYLAFKNAMESKLMTSELNYKFEDLDYPAVSIDVSDGHLGTLVGAYVGGGEAYEFGDSVNAGTSELLRVVNGSSCRNTKYVLAGYSQGTLVVLNALSDINPEKVIYAATFGDPKIYLPEGAGMVPSACSGKSLSEYRIYVPDCRAYKGIMGARNPYVIEGYSGKVGTWCNKFDILCSSHFSVKSHTSYAEDGLYEDASRYIFSKIGKEFNFKNQYTSPHDTAILIDSTGSMSGLIDKYKAEALKLAEKTLETGGRVALYDYRDLDDEYIPVERCNFETCNIDTFQAGLDEILIDGGGDEPESLLSASFHVMRKLNWKFGSTKSLVILTDAGYHSPDLDGVSFYDVQKLSKQIDPVNIYIITEESMASYYDSLVKATDGAVVSSVDELRIMSESIMKRFDSLPRVEEEFEDEMYENELPVIKIRDVEEVSETAVKISFENTGEATVLLLNDGLIGTTYESEITISDLKRDIKNSIVLVPLSKTRRGESVMVNLGYLDGYGGEIEGGQGDGLSEDDWMNGLSVNDMEFDFEESLKSSGEEENNAVIPKAPNTGRR